MNDENGDNSRWYDDRYDNRPLDLSDDSDDAWRGIEIDERQNDIFSLSEKQTDPDTPDIASSADIEPNVMTNEEEPTLDYKPSPDAIAATEFLRAKGIDKNNIRAAMYGVDMSNQIALDLGVPQFQARIFDPKAAPQSRKAVSIAIEKNPSPVELNQPAPSPRR